MRELTKEEIEVLQRHAKWLKNEEGGERADLHEADLRGADLHEANLRWADLRGADLHEANLRWADLRGADLHEANLREADLRGADLYGANGKILSFGPIGSRQGITYVTKTEQIIHIRCGCFYGTLEEFTAKVEAVHGESKHGKSYKAAIEFIKSHDAACWQGDVEE
ncbi:Pentapeptide repeat family protein [Bilophila wadsworthia]